MENTALKLSAKEIIKEFTETTGNTDFLKIFLITNSADIAREYDFLTKLIKNASDADKAIYKKACKTLINMSLRRIAVSDMVYSANDSQSAISVIEPETIQEVVESPTIMMLPSLDDILARVKFILTNETDPITRDSSAFELLKTTVGQGKVLNAEGKPETWDNEHINTFLTEFTPIIATEIIVAEVVAGEKFGFKTAFNHLTSMIEHGKEEPEIKEALKSILIGKIIAGSTPENDYFIKDEKVFEDYYTRIVQNIILTGITSFKQKSTTVVDKHAEVDKKIEEEIKPFLKELDKDETQTSFSSVTKKIRDIFKSFGFKVSLPESMLKAKEIAEEVAPNLVKRNKEGNKNNIATAPIEAKVTEPTIEIYDESHNIQESNKPLWADVEKYEYLTQLFAKGVELSKAGNWRDALSMSIILVSSGKIKETETSKESLKWNTDQIKQWYHSNVEVAANQPAKVETIDVKAEIINETKDESKVSNKEGSEKPSESSESSQEAGKETAEVKQGPVPQVGSIEPKENLSRLLKDNSLWKDKYSFTSFLVKTDHHRGGAMSLEIVDATSDQEKDLLVTEPNMTKFLDELRDKLIVTRNAYPEVKKILSEKLLPFYEMTNSEIKRIVGNLSNEADAIRKENKTANVEAPKTEKVMEIEDKSEKVVVEIPPITPAVKEESVASSDVKKEDPSLSEATENTAGEPSTNSNDDNTPSMSYEGFEDILKAKSKLDMNKAIYTKIKEYAKSEDGIKAVFEIVNVARKDHHYKKAFLRNYKAADPIDLLAALNNIVTLGAEASKKQ